MPRRSAKPPYEIFQNAPASLRGRSGRHTPSEQGQGAPTPARSGRGRRVLRVPDVKAVSALLVAFWAAVARRSRGVADSAGERYSAARRLWRQRLEQRAMRQAEAAAKKTRVVESSAGAWWIASGKPVVLRVTRGLVVLGIAGVVGLVLLAYWLGRGDGGVDFRGTWPGTADATGADEAAKGDPAALADASGEMLADVPGGSDPTSGVVVPKPRRTPPPAADPRVIGRNYLAYTLTDLGTARQLAAFLRDQGARISIVPTQHPAPEPVRTALANAGESGDTSVLYMVIDVTQGFTTPQYQRGEHHRFLAERLTLGRAWKRHNADRGSALESMTFYKYLGSGDASTQD